MDIDVADAPQQQTPTGIEPPQPAEITPAEGRSDTRPQATAGSLQHAYAMGAHGAQGAAAERTEAGASSTAAMHPGSTCGKLPSHLHLPTIRNHRPSPTQQRRNRYRCWRCLSLVPSSQSPCSHVSRPGPTLHHHRKHHHIRLTLTFAQQPRSLLLKQHKSISKPRFGSSISTLMASAFSTTTASTTLWAAPTPLARRAPSAHSEKAA